MADAGFASFLTTAREYWYGDDAPNTVTFRYWNKTSDPLTDNPDDSAIGRVIISSEMRKISGAGKKRVVTLHAFVIKGTGGNEFSSVVDDGYIQVIGQVDIYKIKSARAEDDNMWHIQAVKAKVSVRSGNRAVEGEF